MKTALAFVAIAVFFLPEVVCAQGRDDDRRSRGGERDPRESLRRFDRNGNGTLEQEEIPSFMNGYVGRLAETAGLDRSQPLPIEKLTGAPPESSSVKSDASTTKSDSSSTNKDERREERREERRSSSSANPLTPGFGTNDKPPAAPPGFNVPLQFGPSGMEQRYDKRILDHVENEVLRKYDVNKNGILEIEETKDGQWSPDPRESDLDKDGRLVKYELYERYAKKFNLPPKGSTTATSVAGSTGSTSAFAAKPSGDVAKVREYAQGLLNRYDANKSGFLEKDEWREMKSDHQAADVNHDGIITVDELAAKLSGYGSSTTTATASSTPSASSPPATSSSTRAPSRKWWQPSSSSSTGSSTSKPSDKKSYRFLSPTERLPKGLPDWFARNDADGDGQVLMSEYAASWNDTVASEFAKYDLDADGVITPEECLAVEKAKKK